MNVVHSLRAKLVALLAVFVLGTLLICILLNSVFLQNYYIESKKMTLEAVYNQLMKLDEPSTYFRSDQDDDHQIAKFCEVNNVSFCIYSTDGMAILGNGSQMIQKLGQRLINGDSEYTNNVDQVNEFQYAQTGIYYMEMHGFLKDNSFYIVGMAVDSIKKSVDITTRFFTYISLIALVCSIFFMWGVTKRFTQPIYNLVNISNRMCNLDFNAQYQASPLADEVDMLGNSMNKLSKKLETTILELKSANNELKNDLKRRTEVDNMRKDFISNVSHELKTPIALIQGYAEGLKEGINDDDQESRDFYCDVIMDEATRMNKLVRNLLSLNQLEYGSTPLEMSRFDLVPVIEGVLNTVKLLIEQKEAKIIFNNQQSVMVWADEFQVEQVITNYVNNALNHLDGERVISIDLARHEGIVHVTVFNTGKNIPQEDLDKIWIKFYKVDKARTREYGGNGIGLSIVKAIMDLHNKQCGVHNMKNGVVFWFELDDSSDESAAPELTEEKM